MKLISLFFCLVVLISFIHQGTSDSPDTMDLSILNNPEAIIGTDSSALIPVDPYLKTELVSTTDLAIAGSITPKKAEMEFPFSASIFVVNAGPAAAEDIQIDYFLVRYNETEEEPIWIHQKTADTIPAFYRDSVGFTVTMPGGISPGLYSLYGTIKTTTSDRNLTNNQYRSEAPINIQGIGRTKEAGIADLAVIIDSTVPEKTAPGYPLTIHYTALNSGGGSSGTFRIGFYLSDDPEITPSDTKIWDEIYYKSYPGMIEPGVSLDIIPLDIIPGDYYLGAIADFTHMVKESDENNNAATYGFPITVADFPPPINESFLNKVTGYLAVKTNVYRQRLGLSNVSYDQDLGEIAKAHSIDMASRNYFLHETPEGLDPTDRAKLAKYDVTRRLSDGTIRTGIAENIIKISSGHIVGKGYSGFVDPSDPQAVADVMMIEWISSPVHNENLINDEIENVGIGVAYNGEYFYGTQNFY